MNLYFPLIAMGFAALSACTPSLNHRLRGQPVAVAVERMGISPANAFDLPDGRRVFEWNTSDMLVIEGNAYDHQPRWWTTERERLSGSSMANCVDEVIAKWDLGHGTWIVQRYRNKWTESCSMRRPRT